MKRIFIPTESAADWQRLLAKPTLHWKRGYSAMTAAAAWEAAGDGLPPEIPALLNTPGAPALTALQLLAAIPEWQVELPGGSTNSCTDVLALCRNESGLAVIGVEAKVLEDFGPTIAEKRTKASPGQNARLAYLHQILQVERFDDTVRYQLLHRTASALLTARAFHAATAVMLVQAFGTPIERRADFEAFRKAMKATEVAPLLYRAPTTGGPALFLGWCDGDQRFQTQDFGIAAA